MTANALTPRQQRFVDEYLIDLNATAAYKRAGYEAKDGRSSENAASRLLGHVGVAAAIAERQVERSEKTGITAAWALQRLKEEAEFHGEGASHGARVSAINTAMKHLGMLTEKIELAGTFDVQIIEEVLASPIAIEADSADRSLAPHPV